MWAALGPARENDSVKTLRHSLHSASTATGVHHIESEPGTATNTQASENCATAPTAPLRQSVRERRVGRLAAVFGDPVDGEIDERSYLVELTGAESDSTDAFAGRFGRRVCIADSDEVFLV